MSDISLPGLDAFLAPPPAPASPSIAGLDAFLTDVARGEAVVGPLLADYVPPPPPPPEPPTHAGPAPRRRGRPKSPWLARAEAERAERDANPEPTLEQQILQLAMDPEGREALLKLLAAEAARKSFAEFFRQAWLVLEPTTELVWNWHLQLMCNVAQAVFFEWLKARKDRKYLNKIRNVLVNVPPGSSKSRIFSVCFQAWCWLYVPGMKFIALSVNDDASMRDARDMRLLVRSDWYIESFKPEWHIKEDQDAVSNFGTTGGGARLSMASRSVIVGLRADLLSVDDANDPTETEKERKEVNKIWDDSQANRVNDLDRSMRFGIQQRTGAGDWSDHVIERQGVWSPENRSGWLHVVLPGEYEAARKFRLPDVLVELLREHLPPEEWIFEDPRTEEGDTIDHERMSKAALADERKRWEGTGNYAAQIQQRPALLEGSRVRRDYWSWFRLEGGIRGDIDELPKGHPRPEHCPLAEKLPATVIRAAKHRPGFWDFDWVVISLDCALKKTERGSNWGILVVAGKEGRRYVLDDRSQRGDILEIIEIIRTLIRLWKPDKVLIEDAAAGDDMKRRLVAEMSKGDMPMITLESVKVLGNVGKEERLDACISVIANHMVYLLDEAPWLEAFVEELALFPFGKRSDRVDALTQVLNRYKDYDADAWPDL